jgi:hypothetical protein
MKMGNGKGYEAEIIISILNVKPFIVELKSSLNSPVNLFSTSGF